MRDKKIIFTIDNAYITKYQLDQSFLGKKIVIYDDRLIHIKKHENEFISLDEYQNAINSIFSIVSQPDFIVIDTVRKSLEFVKKLSCDVLIAARLSISNELKIKTLYPINKSKKDKLYKQSTNQIITAQESA